MKLDNNEAFITLTALTVLSINQMGLYPQDLGVTEEQFKQLKARGIQGMSDEQFMDTVKSVIKKCIREVL